MGYKVIVVGFFLFVGRGSIVVVGNGVEVVIINFGFSWYFKISIIIRKKKYKIKVYILEEINLMAYCACSESISEYMQDLRFCKVAIRQEPDPPVKYNTSEPGLVCLRIKLYIIRI